MSFITWTPPALSSEARPWQASVWRMVEAQHIAATMKLVDSPAEQDLLESLLEGSKPPSPGSTAALDYLLAAPFRYTPLRGGSRFRGATDPGVFYGADTALTACAELGYWRWRFLQDAPALEYLEPVAHTAFRTRIATTAIDLRQPPWPRMRRPGPTPPTTPPPRPSPARPARLPLVPSCTPPCARPLRRGARPY